MIKKLLSLTVINCFFLTTLVPLPQAHADSVLGLPAPGTMINLSPAYEPVMIKGLTIHKDNPFLFDFIVDVGQDRMSGEPLKKEGEKLIKYFLASLAIPDKDVWVNLSPYEKNKMIPEALGQTDMGRDLLEQDYILKQITASLIYPEKQLGKTFWDTVYSKAREMYGTAEVPVNTFNKVWIMADRAEVYEHNQTAFVVGQHLKVMLEEDYLALTHHTLAKSHTIASQVVKQVILPELEKEVNTGKNFANLRQIFNSIILSSWYKKNLQQALLNQVYADKSKVKGINLNDPTVKEQIYEQYLAAYKKGVFNYIKEDVNAPSGETLPRKYFSGGIDEAMAADPEITNDTALLTNSLPQQGRLVDFATVATTRQGNPDAGHPLEFRLGEKTYQGKDVVSLDRRLYDYLQILNDFKKWANGEYNENAPFLNDSKIKFIWEPVSEDHFFSKGAASMQEAVIAQYPIQGVTRNLANSFVFYERLPREELIRRINAAMYRLSKDYTAVSDVLDAAMTGKPAFTDPVAAAYIQAESILNQLMFPNLRIVFNFNKKDAIEQAQDILRKVVRSGAAQVLADYIGQEGIDFQDPTVRQEILDFLSVIKGKVLSNGAYNAVKAANEEMDALKEAERFLRQAAEINNPIERQAIVVLALDRLYSINNPPAYSLREFLKSHISLTRSWARINGFLTQADRYIRVHDSAMATTVPALEISPALARAFDEQVGNFTATGRPTAGKDTLMPIFIEKMNKLLPEGRQIVTVSTGEYVAGIIRLVKNEYTQDQAGLKASDEAKYGAYMGLLDDEDRAKMEGGALVKDATMYRIINKIFEEPWIANAKHIFFNGFPRNIGQWNAIREGKVLLRGKPLVIDFFLDINLPREATFARAERRTQDRIREGLPPRKDDDPLIVGKRQNEFDTVTKPMVDDIASQNPAQFRRISSYFPDDSYEESLRKTNDQLVRVLHDFLSIPMHYNTYQQLFEAAEQGAFETKKRFYIRTADSPSSREVMVSNIGDDWISGYEIAAAGVVKFGQGIVVIHKDEFTQAREADSAMAAGPTMVYDNYRQMYDATENGAFKYVKFVDITYKGNGPDQKARVRVSDIGVVWTDGFKIDEIKGIETERIRISKDNFLRAQVADQAMTARDIAEMFLEDINEGNFRAERYTNFKYYTGAFPIKNISLQPGDIVLDDNSLEQQLKPLGPGKTVKISANSAYVFTGIDGRVVVFAGSGRGNGTVLTVADKAVVAQAPFTRGGIDLNTSNGMQWKISKDGRGVEMDIDPAMIERLRHEGIDSLSPVVLRITPVADIQSLY